MVNILLILTKNTNNNNNRTFYISFVICLRICVHIYRIQNPDVSRSIDSGRRKARRRVETIGQDRTPTDRFAQDTNIPLTPQSIEENSPQRLLGSTSTYRIQNQDIPRAGRVGAARNGASGRDWAGQHRMPKNRFAQERTGPLTLQGTATMF